MAKKGRKTINNYSIEQAADFLAKKSEIGVIVPPLKDYLIDIAEKGGRPGEIAGAPAFYREIGAKSIDDVVAFAGLLPEHGFRIAAIPETNIPNFVFEKVVKALGRDALIEYLNQTVETE